MRHSVLAEVKIRAGGVSGCRGTLSVVGDMMCCSKWDYDRRSTTSRGQLPDGGQQSEVEVQILV